MLLKSSNLHFVIAVFPRSDYLRETVDMGNPVDATCAMQRMLGTVNSSLLFSAHLAAMHMPLSFLRGANMHAARLTDSPRTYRKNNRIA